MDKLLLIIFFVIVAFWAVSPFWNPFNIPERVGPLGALFPKPAGAGPVTAPKPPPPPLPVTIVDDWQLPQTNGPSTMEKINAIAGRVLNIVAIASVIIILFISTLAGVGKIRERNFLHQHYVPQPSKSSSGNPAWAGGIPSLLNARRRWSFKSRQAKKSVPPPLKAPTPSLAETVAASAGVCPTQDKAKAEQVLTDQLEWFRRWNNPADILIQPLLVGRKLEGCDPKVLTPDYTNMDKLLYPELDQETLKRAYKIWAKSVHPDAMVGLSPQETSQRLEELVPGIVGNRDPLKVAEEVWKRISDAWGVLENPEKRARFDRCLKRAHQRQVEEQGGK